VDFDTADCDSDDDQQQHLTNNSIENLNKSANDHANKSSSESSAAITSKKFTIKDSMSAKKSTNEAESIKKSDESPSSGEKNAAKKVTVAADNGKDDKSCAKEKTRDTKSEM